MTILVTGGAGYIGSVMTEVLVKRGRPVVVLDNLSRGHRAAVPPSVPLYEGDISDARAVERVFDDHPVSAVLHFAADSLVGESMRDPARYFANNTVGVLNLLQVLRDRGVQRFVLSSTAATYGDPAEVPILESTATDPTNPYGESKRMCERMLHWFGRVHGMRWAALRYFNAAGATEERGEDHEPETHLIPLALDAALGRRAELRVFGLDYPTPDGTCVRDYVHVEDLADAHLLALQHLEEAEHAIVNLGNGQGFSVLEVIQSVERVSGREVPWQPAPRRAGDPPRLVASSERAKTMLGWRPERDQLDQIVESALRWRLAHANGYRE